MNQAIGKFRWTICGLLFFATTVNYLDRQVLSLLSADLSKEFGWTNIDYGRIVIVFQLTYAIAMLFAGRVIDALGTKKAFLLAICVWSLGAIAHAYAIGLGHGFNAIITALGFNAIPVSIAGFMVARAFLAIGEAGNFPAAIKATAEYFPRKERSFATGIFNSGANVGAILAPLSVPLIALYWGWQAAFLAIGAIGFIWMAFWAVLYDDPAKQKRLSKEELTYINADAVVDTSVDGAPVRKTSWFQLLTFRQTWAFTIGKFLTDGVWWFFLFWLPKYLSAQYGMGKADIVIPLAVLYSMTMVGSIGGGWFPAYFMKRGDSAYNGRMKAMLCIAFFPLVVLLAQPLGYISYWMPVLLIGVGASAHQAWSANLFTTVSDMFPKHSVGSVVGIGGASLTELGGRLFDYYQGLGHIETGYTIMFSICAVAYLVAWTIMKTLVPVHKEVVLNPGLAHA
ncbi:MAG: MFS transporter [Massilia sp.]